MVHEQKKQGAPEMLAKRTKRERRTGPQRALRFALGVSTLMSVFAVAVHCSLTVSPGDYTSGLRVPPDAGPPSHVVVVAGQRDRLTALEAEDIPAADVWMANIDSAGSVVGWTVQPSAPLLLNARTAVVSNGNLYVVADQYSGQYAQHVGVEWIPIGPEGVGPAWQVAFAAIPNFGYLGFLFLPTGLLSFGGFTYKIGDGSIITTYHPDVYFTPFDESKKVFGAPQHSASKLVNPRAPVMSVRYENFFYAVGGEMTDQSASAVVEVSTIGESGLGPFAETTALQDPRTQQPYHANTITLCAAQGSFYVIGGDTLNGPSDIVLMARIDESNGQLSSWQSMPRLPGGRSGAGCFAARDRLYVLGGKGATGRFDAVISAPILPDGSLGDWDATGHAPLPSARSQLAIATY